MSLVTMEHLTKSYTERLLFDDTAFSMEEGEKVGLIGINGTGKSTLLKIVAGIEEPDEGKVIFRRNLYIRYLPQNPEFHPGDTILESIVRDNEKEPHFTSREELEASAKRILTKLGIYDYEANVDHLSGGQKKRVALASVLLSTADLLILDEPTNHLDSDMADWLETYLRQFAGALLMITHDRYFLDCVTTRIVELDQGKLYSYDSNYEGFVKGKAERMDRSLASERKRQSILRKELEWMQRGARARSTKQKAHIQRYEALRDQEAPKVDAEVELNSVSSRLGKKTVELLEISKSYGEKLLILDFTYIFLKNDRVGIIGPNGSGKSTLLKMITGWTEPDKGEIQFGTTVKLGYFSQENEAMDESLKVIDYIRNVAEFVQTKDGSVSASQMLERFLFPGSIQHTKIEKLSGGEKRRLYLLRILMDAPNVLLLDEPTNDLDIRTLTILEDYLDSFPGIVVTVSHDRYFLDRVVRRIFAFEGLGAVVQYEGGFTDYQAAFERKRREREDGWITGEEEGKKQGKGKGTGGAGGKKGNDQEEPEKSKTGKKERSTEREHQKKLKFTFKEQKEWETIETEIGDLEQKLEDLDQQIEESATVFGKLGLLMEEKAETEKLLEEKMDRWVYLNELAERIKGGE
ncbi:MAG: ABC-F family ATP-binding cassette domain-containing protein [Lachnospiraceae bacterium]|nr:ABC-F family ATP-binding cassette domain-containing protein [Lachnospiraceae bacterium]